MDVSYTYRDPLSYVIRYAERSLLLRLIYIYRLYIQALYTGYQLLWPLLTPSIYVDNNPEAMWVHNIPPTTENAVT